MGVRGGNSGTLGITTAQGGFNAACADPELTPLWGGSAGGGASNGGNNWNPPGAGGGAVQIISLTRIQGFAPVSIDANGGGGRHGGAGVYGGSGGGSGGSVLLEAPTVEFDAMFSILVGGGGGGAGDGSGLQDDGIDGGAYLGSGGTGTTGTTSGGNGGWNNHSSVLAPTNGGSGDGSLGTGGGGGAAGLVRINTLPGQGVGAGDIYINGYFTAGEIALE